MQLWLELLLFFSCCCCCRCCCFCCSCAVQRALFSHLLQLRMAMQLNRAFNCSIPCVGPNGMGVAWSSLDYIWRKYNYFCKCKTVWNKWYIVNISLECTRIFILRQNWKLGRSIWSAKLHIKLKLCFVLFWTSLNIMLSVDNIICSS